eukprot:scaffold17253_cov78-Skeletonema_dohrnii-CCMP3373.AAC.1
MKTATHLLCTVAVIVTSSQHRCSAYVTAPSSFGIKSYAPAIRGKKDSTTTGTSRASSTCMYSVPYLPNMEEEGDDGSFFLSASQQAANDRYELLKQGKDPLAISLSTAPAQEESQEQQQQEKEEITVAVNESDSIDDNTGVESLPTLQNDDYDDLLSSLSESPMAQSLEEEEKEDTTAATELEESSASSTLDKIKRVENEIAAVKSQIKYKFQKRLMDTRMQLDDAERVGEGSTAEEMEVARNARLAAADQVKQVLVSGEELEEEDEAAAAVPTITDSTSTVDAGEGSTAEEMEEARKARLAEADEIAMTLKNIEPTAVTAPTTSTLQ